MNSHAINRFLNRNSKARREWRDIVPIQKDTYLVKLPCINKGEIQTFQDEQKLKESVTTWSDFQNGLHTETKIA